MTAIYEVPAQQDLSPEGNPFDLPPGGLEDSKRRAALAEVADYFGKRLRKFLGGSTDQCVDYQTDLTAFLEYPLFYFGDPFEDSYFGKHIRSIERAVLDYYARLWHATPRSGRFMDEDAYWGYLPTMGSSEGLLYALWTARDYLSGKMLVAKSSGDGRLQQIWVQDTPPAGNRNAYSPVAFYSEDTHYSVTKVLRVLGIPSFYEVGFERYPYANPLSPGQPWPKEVPCLGGATGPGSVDIDKLLKLVDFFASMGHPVLINLNYCTSFKGAYDDVEEITARLRPIFAKYGLSRRRVRYGRDKDGKDLVDERTGYWINIDGAIGAMYAPFLHTAIQQGRVLEKGSDVPSIRLPKFDFEIPEVCSIVTSGHKYIHSPWPFGVFMAKRKLHMTAPGQPDATSAGDTTFGGSRNALAPIALWDFLAQHSEQDQIDMIVEAQELAKETQQKLQALGPHWDVHRSPWSLDIWFKKPPQDIVDDFFLITAKLEKDDTVEEYARFYGMPPITRERRERAEKLVERMANATPLPPQTERHLTTGADAIADTDLVRCLALVPTHRRCL